ncbi:VOC family protein [Leisingera aquaemixtae]|uniref:Putative lactoylglutathione lyase n=1 Tax=Leisingera aquaemixtae TaxID=1396826 RepID=A0A0P1HPH0_9RHOB|nr:VOC family protein [Leisingera aquaemixtae]UWQ38611.1 VOC family protein [Leisingera aquaemixtae]UWQ42713.1 VOC family protein [Leisingera aquaemixtae]UWQ47016.1 VOC family protein [Leisingera aquaemixtae]CUI01847.1 putative lactoylglutathione lyase [Leisingera aquaemixtae]
MEQRVSLITLGVPDMEKAAAFYEALGWQRAESPDGVIAFDLISQTLGLYPLAALAEDIGVPEAELGTGAMTLSHNTRSREAVAELLAAAEAAGAEVLKPAQDVFWGGHHGYFRSPDGHVWEIAFNPFSPLAQNGAFRWNGY